MKFVHSAADELNPGVTAVSITKVADSIDVRLLGFAGFEASERFLRGLAEEIWVLAGTGHRYRCTSQLA